MADIPKPLDKTVTESMEKAREAVNQYLDAFEKNMELRPWGSGELVDRARRFSTENVNATFDFLNKLSKAKDFEDIARIQAQFMQKQMASFVNQFSALGDSYAKALGAAVKATSPAKKAKSVD